MADRLFGWSLPPGVTHAMIDAQMGEEPEELEPVRCQWCQQWIDPDYEPEAHYDECHSECLRPFLMWDAQMMADIGAHVYAERLRIMAKGED